jgi:hypothetical protein
MIESRKFNMGHETKSAIELYEGFEEKKIKQEGYGVLSGFLNKEMARLYNAKAYKNFNQEEE